MMRRAVLGLSICLALSFLFGCKSRQPQQQRSTEQLVIDTILKRADSLAVKFNSIRIKGKGDFEGPDQKLGFSYNLDMEEDSSLWLSITKFGYEGLRALGLTDSVKLKITDQKKVIYCDYEIAESLTGIPVALRDAQDILIGRPVFFTDSLKVATISEKEYVLSAKRGKTTFQYSFDRGNFRLNRFTVKSSQQNAHTEVTYGDFELVGEQIIAKRVQLEVFEPEELTIEFRHNRIQIDENEARTSFRKPRTYEVEYCKVK